MNLTFTVSALEFQSILAESETFRLLTNTPVSYAARNNLENDPSKAMRKIKNLVEEKALIPAIKFLRAECSKDCRLEIYKLFPKHKDSEAYKFDETKDKSGLRNSKVFVEYYRDNFCGQI